MSFDQRRTTHLSSHQLAAFVLLVALAAGCGQDDNGIDPRIDSGLGAGDTASPSPDAGVPVDGELADTGGTQDVAGETAAPPLYAVTTQVFGAQGADTHSYVVLTNALSGRLALETAVLEVPGRALGTGPNNGGALYLASDSAPTVTRYLPSDDGKLTPAGTVSFLGQGISGFGEYGGQFQYVAPDKAYWFDAATARIVPWNPSAMTAGGHVPLDELAVPGEGLSFTAVPLRVGSTIYTFAAWRKGPVPITVSSRAAVVALDTTTDQAKVVTDTRCGYVRDGVLGADGFIYMATETLGAAVHYLEARNAPAPCLLRFDPRAGAFDPTFKVDLMPLFGGAVAGSLVIGTGGRSFLRFLDVALLPKEATDPINLNPRALASAAVWRWAVLTVGDVPAVMPIDTAAASGSVLPLRLGDRIYAPLFQGQAETSLAELGDAGLGASVASVPGLVFSAVKLR